MNDSTNWPRNRLLLALSARNLKQLMPDLDNVRCQREQVLLDADSSLDHVYFPDSGVLSVLAVYANGDVIEMATIGREGCSGMQAIFGAKVSSVDADSSLDHVYFPDSGVLSVLAVYANGDVIEMATIGREGCSGMQAIFGAKVSSAQLLVQIPGTAAKMWRAAFTRAMPPFRSLMYSYVHAFLEQVMVSVACNGAHSLKERLARWLLMMHDRSDDDELPITQDLLAEMLGVQRPTISNAVRELEQAGWIERGRRQVTILDRQGLADASCECYQLVRARLAFHLPKTYT
jgi:CRP-like cAMP-binding protein